MDGGRRRRGSNQEEVEEEGGRGQAAGRRLVTVKSIIIIIRVFFSVNRFPERNATLAFALSPIPTGNPDACIYECFLKHSISAKAIFPTF